MAELKRTIKEIDADIEATRAALADVHGSETEVYARIVGYYRAVRNWNKGKREEYDHRKMFAVPESAAYEITEADNACECSSPARVTQPAPKAAAPRGTESLFENKGSWELFSRKTCPNCPPVQAYMAKLSMSGKTIDVDTEAGLSEAAKKGVFASPTVIVYDESGEERARCHSVEELSAVFASVTA